MNWLIVNVGGAPLKPIFAHSTVVVDSKILIFGGISVGTFNTPDIKIIELDQEKARKMALEQN